MKRNKADLAHRQEEYEKGRAAAQQLMHAVNHCLDKELKTEFAKRAFVTRMKRKFRYLIQLHLHPEELANRQRQALREKERIRQ